MGAAGRGAGYVATGAILGGFVLSLAAMICWIDAYGMTAGHHSDTADGRHAVVVPGESLETTVASETLKTRLVLSVPTVRPVAAAADGEHAKPHDVGHDAHSQDAHAATTKVAYFDDWYTLVGLDNLKITIGYYIDALTVVMFCMVTLIATCIHFYAIGYMHEELEDVTDHEVTLSNGEHLHRKGRYYRFFQYLSLFCFSMLGIVIAGNIAMTFIFWELVGICSYFLIGFYIERKSASTAANKAFIVNRVGDVGMIIGLMALWGSLGTFSFGGEKNGAGEIVKPGLFEQVRPVEEGYQLKTPEGMEKRAKVHGRGGSGLHRTSASCCCGTRNFLWLCRQECPVPPACLVARCDGGTNSCFCPGALSHHGCGRCVSRWAFLPNVHSRGVAHNRHHRLHYAFYGGHHCHYCDRHQTCSGLLNTFTIGLHDVRVRGWRVGGRNVAFDHPCVF